jgi:hypothetical protein
MPTVHGHFIYHPGSIKRLVHILAANGVHSREDLMERYDVDARSYEALKGVGPKLSELLIWLRGKSINEWRELTGLDAFNNPKEEAASKGITETPDNDEGLVLPPSSADQDWG